MGNYKTIFCFIFLFFNLPYLNSAPLFDGCKAFENTTTIGVDVKADESVFINTDHGVMTICKNGNCSRLNNTVVIAHRSKESQMTTFFINGNFHISGELQFRGLHVVSISSCYGNITINSTHAINVRCTNHNGHWQNCHGTENCHGCHFYSIGGGGGGNGGVCNYNNKCYSSHAHTTPNGTITIRGGNPGCHYQKTEAKGGGGLELKALDGIIKIESIIDASGESFNDMCGAGAGGTLRLTSDHVDISGEGRLLANGGRNRQNLCSLYYGTYGGGGGTIQIITTQDSNLTADSLSVDGGEASCSGKDGIISIEKSISPCSPLRFGSYDEKGKYFLTKTRYDHTLTKPCYYGPHDETITFHCTEPWRMVTNQQWSKYGRKCWTKSTFISKLPKRAKHASQSLDVLHDIIELLKNVKQFSIRDVESISKAMAVTSGLNSIASSQLTSTFHIAIDKYLRLNETLILKSQMNTNSSTRIITALEKFHETQRHVQKSTPFCFNFKHFSLISTTLKTGEFYSFKKHNVCGITPQRDAKQREVQAHNAELKIQDDDQYVNVVLIVYKDSGLFSMIDGNERGQALKTITTTLVFDKAGRRKKNARAILRYPKTGKKNMTHCVSWTFGEKNNLGDWLVEGCHFKRNNEEKYDECNCESLNNVAIMKNTAACQRHSFGVEEGQGIFRTKKILQGHILFLDCPYGPDNIMIRATCILPWEQKAEDQWSIIGYDNCLKRRDTFARLVEDVHFKSNISKITKRIKQLTEKSETLGYDEIGNISLILETISKNDIQDSQAALNFHRTVDNLLQANGTQLFLSQEKCNSTNRLLESIERYSEKTTSVKDGESDYKVQLKNYAVSVTSLQSKNITAIADSSIFQIYNSHKPVCPSWFSASLNIPDSVVHRNKSKLMLILYRKTDIFKDRRSFALQSDEYVVSATVPGNTIRNYSQAIFIQYPKRPNDNKKRKCVFWDFMANKRLGGWSEVGCVFVQNDEGVYGCRCNHFTNFAMLLDLEPGKLDGLKAHMKTLSIISYIGCSLSLIGILLTIFTIIFFRELLVSLSCKIILNISLSLGSALIIFLAAAERAKTTSDSHCIGAAICLHYFLLVAISWMIFEGYTMYFAFVKVLPKAQFDEKVPRMWICFMICWGIPAIIVAITAGVAHESYGNNEFCFLQGQAMLVAFFIPVVILVPFNTAMYILVMRSLLRSGRALTSTNITKGIEQARRGIAISVFLGLTWVFGVVAVREGKVVFQYIFCFVNTLQGWMIFVFYCVFSTDVRGKYKQCLCGTTPSKQLIGEKGTTSTWTTENTARHNARDSILYQDEDD